MEPKFLEIIRDSALLAKDVQPLIEKHSACKGKASKVSDALVANSLIPIEKRAELENNLRDPEFAYDLLIKLASRVSAESLGELGDQFNSSGISADDNFLNWIIS